MCQRAHVATPWGPGSLAPWRIRGSLVCGVFMIRSRKVKRPQDKKKGIRPLSPQEAERAAAGRPDKGEESPIDDDPVTVAEAETVRVRPGKA